MTRAVVEGRLSKAHAARTYGVKAKVVARWVERFRIEGSAGMVDRPSRPKTSPRRTGATMANAIVALRRQRLTGQHIAKETGVSEATVSRVLACAGLSRLKDLESAEPVRRHEREHPGELIHLDIKKLGRIGSVGHRITGRYPGAVNRHLGIGWESSTSASTMPHASLSSRSRSCPTSARRALSASLRPPSLITPASASKCSA